METKLKSFETFTAYFCLFIGISCLLCCTKAENEIDPTDNQNLSPIQAWRSAEYCLKNISSSCPDKYKLSDSGWLNVTNEDGRAFCESGGCGEHTRAVLLCIDHVKRDYWFANKANVHDLVDTINQGCTQGFTGVSKYSSDGYRLNSASIIIGLSATALLLITLF